MVAWSGERFQGPLQCGQGRGAVRERVPNVTSRRAQEGVCRRQRIHPDLPAWQRVALFSRGRPMLFPGQCVQ